MTRNCPVRFLGEGAMVTSRPLPDSKCAPQEALRDLDNAFKHFFRRCQLKKEGKWKKKLGYPKYKTKRKGLGSFRLTGSIQVDADAIDLPRLGRLRLKERGYLPASG